MLISNITFWFFLVASIVVTFFGFGYFNDSKHEKYLYEKTGIKISSLMVSYLLLGHPLLLIMYFFAFSNTLVINENRTYEDKILIIPMQVYGYNLTYGNSCYVINNSSRMLKAQRNYYGNIDFDTGSNFDTDQNAFSVKEYGINAFDNVLYIPTYIRIRGGGSPYRYSIDFY